MQPYIDESAEGVMETVELESDLKDELKSLATCSPKGVSATQPSGKRSPIPPA